MGCPVVVVPGRHCWWGARRVLGSAGRAVVAPGSEGGRTPFHFSPANRVATAPTIGGCEHRRRTGSPAGGDRPVRGDRLPSHQRRRRPSPCRGDGGALG